MARKIIKSIYLYVMRAKNKIQQRARAKPINQPGGTHSEQNLERHIFIRSSRPERNIKQKHYKQS